MFVIRACATLARVIPNLASLSCRPPVVPHARARRPRRWRRLRRCRRRRHTRARRLDDATARAIARHCTRLCRARVSLTRTSSRAPASLLSSPTVVPDARARRRRRRGGGGTARARRLDDATKHAISRVIARVFDASVGHSCARHPEPRFPLVFPPSSPTRARGGHSGGGGGGGGGTRARVASMARWRASSRVIARAFNARACHSHARHPEPPLPSRRLPLSSPTARARGGGGGSGVAAAAWRRRHARVGARNLPRHRARS